MRSMKVCAVQVVTCYYTDFRKLFLNAAEIRFDEDQGDARQLTKAAPVTSIDNEHSAATIRCAKIIAV
jgi:hypothetical protein